MPHFGQLFSLQGTPAMRATLWPQFGRTQFPLGPGAKGAPILPLALPGPWPATSWYHMPPFCNWSPTRIKYTTNNQICLCRDRGPSPDRNPGQNQSVCAATGGPSRHRAFHTHTNLYHRPRMSARRHHRNRLYP